MAVIDKTFYRGADAYSDGDAAENAILQIVRDGADFRTLDEVAWPTLYHLSPVRENICNWYPFRPGARVLEVGAGCGAVTGALCGRGLDVYAVDLSLRRSTINYERHRDCDGLHLVVGNLNDVAFPEPFDYVLVFGVLEYAGRFTEGGQPYRRFLERIRGFLKPEGVLLLAIENRMGLKYFAGAPEDHLGEAFAGLRGYDPRTGIRTFSKGELSRLLAQSGFGGQRFYYPYPDYKFPLEIFTDETLASQHYGKPFQVFDRERVDVFPEAEVAGVLAAEGAVGALANSFLVEAAADAAGLDAEHVFYAKLNAGRNAAFRVGTKLCGTDAPERVVKFALDGAAAAHIQRIAGNEAKLGMRGKVLRGRMEDSGIAYPFCSGRTLEDVLREAADRGDARAVAGEFERLRTLATVEAVKPGDAPGFADWFGEEKLPDPEEIWTCPANVDLVPDNVFVEGDDLVLTDCEWVADFPVPVGFILWRSAESAYARIPGLADVLEKAELYHRLGIGDGDAVVYRAWSWHFENVYVSDGSNDRYAKSVRLARYTPVQAEQLEQELKNKDGHIEQLMQSERVLKGEVGSQAAHIEQLMQSERELKGEVANQATHIEQLMLSERTLNGTVARQAAELQAVYNSCSWRMTAVFRKLRGVLVRLIKRHRGEGNP